MSKSSLVNYNFGSLTLREKTLPEVINVTTMDPECSSVKINWELVNHFTSGNTNVVVPLSAGVSFKFIQAQPPNVFYGTFQCGTVGSSFANASDVDFSSGTGSIGDTLDLVCDGVNYYVRGTAAVAGSLIYNDC